MHYLHFKEFAIPLLSRTSCVILQFLGFKANRLLSCFPSSPWATTSLTSMGYSCTASVYYTPTTRVLLLTSLWWYTTRHYAQFLCVPWHSHATDGWCYYQYPDSNNPIIPESLSTTEKSFFTELIMFLTTLTGFEPVPWESKSHVLPLHHRAKAGLPGLHSCLSCHAWH